MSQQPLQIKYERKSSRESYTQNSGISFSRSPVKRKCIIVKRFLCLLLIHKIVNRMSSKTKRTSCSAESPAVLKKRVNKQKIYPEDPELQRDKTICLSK